MHLGDGGAGVVVHPGVYGGCAPARQSGLPGRERFVQSLTRSIFRVASLAIIQLSMGFPVDFSTTAYILYFYASYLRRLSQSISGHNNDSKVNSEMRLHYA